PRRLHEVGREDQSGRGVWIVGSDLGRVRRAIGVDGGEGKEEGGARVIVVRPQRTRHIIVPTPCRRRRRPRHAIGNERDPVVGVFVLHGADGGLVGLLGRIGRRIVAITRLHIVVIP